ncbi:MAG: LysR family transcriptional regulator [Eubacterium sp.]|nr:LysR family transcriptional regulator [Candidatus Colimonas fimequi]
MDFKQLQSFVAVAKYQSFSVAAEKLFISQPTISTHIKLLEEELESKLIIRSSKHLELTPRGNEFFECATNILSLRDGLIERWSGNENTIIRISASTLPATYVLPEVLPGFSSIKPNAYFTIRQSNSDDVVRDVLEDRCSIGLTGTLCENDKLNCVPFYEDSMVIITPVNEHFLKLKTDATLDVRELLKEPIIIRESGTSGEKRADKLFNDLNMSESDLNIVARVNDPEATKNLVAGNMGVSLISHKAALDMEKEKRLLIFPVPGFEMTRKFYIIYKKDYVLQKDILKFIDYLKKFYK